MFRNPKTIPYVIIGLVAVIWIFLLVGCAADSPETAATPSSDTTVYTTFTLPIPPTTTAPPTTAAPTTTVPPTTVYVAPTTTQYVAPPPPVEVVPANDLEAMICATFGDQCSKALSVVYCESRFNPGTVGAAGERGLFQIHPVHIPYLAERGMSWDAMFDPSANIAYAYDLYSRSGWGPWTCA